MGSPRTSRRASSDVESGDIGRGNHCCCCSIVFILGFLLAFSVAAASILFAFHTLQNSSLPLFYFHSFPIVLGNVTDVFAFLNVTDVAVPPASPVAENVTEVIRPPAVTVNITNRNIFRFHSIEGQYTIFYSGHPLGAGIIYAMDLRPRSVTAVPSPAYLYSISSPAHGKLMDVQDQEVEFDVEMRVESALAVWFIRFDLKDSHVSSKFSIGSAPAFPIQAQQSRTIDPHTFLCSSCEQARDNIINKAFLRFAKNMKKKTQKKYGST